MILNAKVSGKDYLVCVCDENLLGKTLVEGDVEIKISRQFYGDKKASEEEVIQELKKATIINAFGEESVNALKKVKDISSTIYIQGVPHAQWVKLF